MSTDIGINLSVGGEQTFKTSLAAISSQIKSLGSELQAVSSAFGGLDNSEETVAQKTNILNQAINANKQKIELLTTQAGRAKEKQRELAENLEKAKREFGENSTEAVKAQNAYNKQTKTVADLDNKISKATVEMNGMKNQMKNLENETKDLSDDFRNAESSTKTFSDTLKGSFLGNLAADAIRNLGNAVRNMAGDFINSAAEIKAESSQYIQTFGEFQAQADAAINRVAENSGMLETRLKGSGAKIYAFARSSGGDVEQSMTLMEKALNAAADSAAYYDKSMEDSTETLMSFLKGNYENDAALGLSATETTRNAAAMELFGQKFNDLSEIQKQETLLKMVTDAQELSGAMGQASREAEGWENIQGNLQDAIKQLQGNIGAPLLEALTPAIETITGKLSELSANFDWEGFSKSIADFVNAIVDNKDSIIAGLTGIAAGLLAWNVANMIMGVVTAIKGFATAMQTATIAQTGLNAAMKANVIILIISLVVTIITYVVTFIATNEEARAKVVAVWNAIKDGIKKAVDKIKGFFEKIITVAKEVLKFYLELPKKMVEIGANLLAGLWNGIKSKIEWLGNKVSGVINSIKEKFTGKGGFDTHSPSKWAEKIGAYTSQGLAIGLTKGGKTAEQAAKNTVAKVKSTMETEISKLNAEIEKMQADAESERAAEELEQYKKNLAEKQAELEKTEPENRQKILDEITKIESDWNKKQTEAARTAEEKRLQDKVSSLNTYKQEYENALSAIENKQSQLSDKLADYGGLLEKLRNDETGEEIIQLASLDDSIKQIEHYNNLIESLQAKGVSKDILSEIAGMSIDDAIGFSEQLDKLSGAKFDEYLAKFSQKQELAAEVSRRFYADEMEELGKSTLAQLAGFSDGFVSAGEAMSENIAEGIKNGQSSIMQALKNAVSGAMDNVVSGMQYSQGRFATASGNPSSIAGDTWQTNITIDKMYANSENDVSRLATQLEYQRRMQVAAKGGRA